MATVDCDDATHYPQHIMILAWNMRVEFYCMFSL
uniref:Uncharacterized protein n=1 Tax=Rhizophora mucronata TaxID=61149 RepID=A0A2P2R0R0_RHIMU